jgi:predicted nucleic acid-binding protein
MIIISDTTPLRYLIEIEEVGILERLFGEVIIPEKVAEELDRPKTPQKVKDWMQSRPDWLKVRKADTSLFTSQKRLDDGEREAFALALELKADAVLLDDKDAAAEAARHNILTIPTFTILEQAAARNLIDLPKTVDELRKTTFRLPPERDIKAMLERDAERKTIERAKTLPELTQDEAAQEKEQGRRERDIER